MPSNALVLYTGATWSALVSLSLAARAALSASPLASGEYLSWLFLVVAPPLAAFLVVRGLTPATPIAQILYNAERAGPNPIGRSDR